MLVWGECGGTQLRRIALSAEVARSNGANMVDLSDKLLLDGCRIDDLGLDFTLPGQPSVTLLFLCMGE